MIARPKRRYLILEFIYLYIFCTLLVIIFIIFKDSSGATDISSKLFNPVYCNMIDNVCDRPVFFILRPHNERFFYLLIKELLVDVI